MVELQENIAAFHGAGAEVLTISTDSAEALTGLREALGLGFTTLMDPGSETIRRYGVLNEEAGAIPHPAAFVIDREGVVRYKRVDVRYVVRPSASELLEALADLGAAGSE